MLIYITAAGTFFFAYGVFLPVMTEELGWSRAEMSAGLTIGLLVFGFSSPLIGASVARYGPRKNIILGNLFAVAGLCATSQCREVWHLYLSFGGMVGLGTAFGQYLPCVTLVNNWFHHNKGRVFGLLVACGGLAGFIFPPLASWLIDAVGWRTTWLVFGAINLSVAVIIGGVILVRNPPKDIGQVPFVMSPKASVSAGSKPEDSDISVMNPGMRQVIRKSTFWYIVMIGVASLFPIAVMNTHQVAYLIDIGFSAIIAASVYSLLSAMSAVGRFGLGALAMRFNLKKLVIAGFSLQIGACIILLFAKTPAAIYLYSILIGLSSGAIWVSVPLFVAKHFQPNRFALVMSWILLICMATESLGSFKASCFPLFPRRGGGEGAESLDLTITPVDSSKSVALDEW